MKKSNNTLVILTPAFPENESATYWVPSQQIFVKAIKKNFPELHVIVLAFQYPDHVNSYTWNGIPVISFNGMHKRKIQRLLLWRNIWRKLKNIYLENKVIGLFSFW